MGYNFGKNRASTKRLKEKVKKAEEFPELKCKKEIRKLDGSDEILVEVGNMYEVKRTENKDFQGNELYNVRTDKIGTLLMTREEIEEYFEVKENGLNVDDMGFKMMGFKIDEKNFEQESEA